MNLETKQEQILNIKPSNKGGFIIVDWLWKYSANVAFFVCDNSSLYLYKMDEKKPVLKLAAQHSFDFQFAWFEVRE